MGIENPQLDESIIQEGQEEVHEPPSKRHRKQAARIIRVTANSFCERVGIDPGIIVSAFKSTIVLFCAFCLWLAFF